MITDTIARQKKEAGADPAPSSLLTSLMDFEARRTGNAAGKPSGREQAFCAAVADKLVCGHVFELVKRDQKTKISPMYAAMATDDNIIKVGRTNALKPFACTLHLPHSPWCPLINAGSEAVMTQGSSVQSQADGSRAPVAELLMRNRGASFTPHILLSLTSHTLPLCRTDPVHRSVCQPTPVHSLLQIVTPLSPTAVVKERDHRSYVLAALVKREAAELGSKSKTPSIDLISSLLAKREPSVGCSKWAVRMVRVALQPLCSDSLFCSEITLL